VGIVPNEATVIRLVGAVLADAHGEWQVHGRRYLSEASMALLVPALVDGDTDPPRSPAAREYRGPYLQAHHSAGVNRSRSGARPLGLLTDAERQRQIRGVMVPAARHDFAW
jgi:hypothetical protein